MVAARFKELLKKYGKVGLGVHFSISGASITGLYVAVKNNIDVESLFEKFGMPSLNKDEGSTGSVISSDDPVLMDDTRVQKKERNRTAELAASSGGALAVALLINKALFPVRVPITLVLTPPIARFLARRNMIKNS